MAAEPGVLDAHVHFWDPAALAYPWLDDLPALGRAFGPAEYLEAAEGIPLEGVVFVEANPRPDQGVEEARRIAAIAAGEPLVAGIVAFVDLTADAAARDAALEALAELPQVRGVRHNVQGNPAGFALQPGFVDGVREAGRRGLVFDLCITHDQLPEATALVDRCPGTRFVLDHCAKPAIRDGLLDPWRAELARLAERANVVCKLSGLTTEAGEVWAWDDLRPYAEHAVEAFGPGRLLYGSDWPVLTLRSDLRGWHAFTDALTAGWSAGERRAFYGGNAAAAYGTPGGPGAASTPE